MTYSMSRSLNSFHNVWRLTEIGSELLIHQMGDSRIGRRGYPHPPFQEGTSNPSFRYNSRQTDFDRKIVKKYLRLKTLPEPRNVPEERANMTLTNSIFLKNSKKVPALLLASFVKSKKGVLMEE